MNQIQLTILIWPIPQAVHRKLSAVLPRLLMIIFLTTSWFMDTASITFAAESHGDPQERTTISSGHAVPGATFRVFLEKGQGAAKDVVLNPTVADGAVHTVIEALTTMIQQRKQYPRFDEALRKDVLSKVVIEPKVYNRFVKEFPFLVARTKQQKQVVLLVNASMLDHNGYLNHPEKLIPRLEREFQWVLSKADTKPKPRRVSVQRDLKTAPIKTSREIKRMTNEEREQALQDLFQSYLTTVDDYQSLMNQPFYDVSSTELMNPTHPDSTIKLYDIRIREALQILIRDPDFLEHTPKAVNSLLTGKIWSVSFVKIDTRDWATRTRVAPKKKSVTVGKHESSIQPAKVLVNYHRKAEPEDPYYAETQGLPMGALPANQLARVIALEIEKNITDKSMRGHVAEDEHSAPQ